MRLPLEAPLSVVATLTDTLRSLSSGQRAWFAYSPAFPEAPLRLRSWEQDPTGSRLAGDCAVLDPSAPRSGGLVSVGEDGWMRFTTSTLLEGQLGGLATWVRRAVEEWPELGRLVHARMQEASAEGKITRIQADPSLWQGIPEVPAEGSLADAHRLLEESSGPLFLALRADRLLLSASLESFEQSLVPLKIRLRGGWLTGVYTVRGGLLQVSDPAGWPAAVERLLQDQGGRFPNFQVLKQARLLENPAPAPEAPLEASPAPRGPDLGLQQSLLSSITAESPVFFWLTQADAAGQHHLLLHPELEGIKALAADLDGPPPLARGQVFGTPQGWLDFRLRADAPSLLAGLIQWTRQHLPTNPGLRRLVGARVTVRDGTGKILHGYRDEAGWSQLPVEKA